MFLICAVLLAWMGYGALVEWLPVSKRVAFQAAGIGWSYALICAFLLGALLYWGLRKAKR